MFRTHSCPQSIGFAFAILIAQCTIVRAASSQTSDKERSEKCTPYASVPLPAEAEKVMAPKTAPACASFKKYRGIGRPVNYAEARACAWQERLAQSAGLGQNEKEPTAWVVGGSLILADIYYNGAGVKKDVPLAMRFACEVDEQMADAAIEDLGKPSGPVYAHRPFEFCDYAMTTFEMNFCEGYGNEIADDRRHREYKGMRSSMTSEQKMAFDKLLAAEAAYIDAHASEVDQGGSIRVIRTLGSEDILKDLFHTEVVQFEHQKWPLLSGKHIAGADALLDREYAKALQRIRTQTKDEIEESDITADGFSKVEVAWKVYRDAWGGFARVRYPGQVDAIRAEITLRRYELVKTIP